MTSNRPYLIRAFYEWITDNGLTPYLLVDATAAGVRVPDEYVEAGRIVLNISPSAVRGLQIGNDGILFSARFGGSSREIAVPPHAVLGVYARENNKGMLFPEDPGDSGPDDGGAEKTVAKTGKRPSLKVVK